MEMKDGLVFLNDASTAGLKERETFLEKNVKGSRAVAYNTIISQTKDQNRELFKSPLVFIYHDTIDAIGDDRKTEKKTFAAALDAINELKKIINQLHNTYNVSKVIITADHGFLYNDRIISEMDKESISGKDTDELHPRYALMSGRPPSKSGYLIPLRKVSTLDDERFILVPAGINRYKVQGAGQQYVHGGASLQEIIVPVIVSTRKRFAVTERVDPVLSNKDLRIVSNMLKIKLVQKEPVSKTRKERHLVVGLYHENQLVSNKAEIVLASGSDLPADRIYTLDLILSAESGDFEVLKLKVFDREDFLNPLIEQNVINTTIIKRDF